MLVATGASANEDGYEELMDMILDELQDAAARFRPTEVEELERESETLRRKCEVLEEAMAAYEPEALEAAAAEEREVLKQARADLRAAAARLPAGDLAPL